MKKLLLTILCLVALASLMLCLIGCNDNEESGIDYSVDNSFEYVVSDESFGMVYAPKDVDPQYGLIFYVGTAIDYSYYQYLGEALAKQGYLVVLPKVKMGLAYLLYNENEPAFDKYPNVEFFVGGHSQGGGAAVRRTQENLAKVKGVVLYAPLCYNEDSIKDSGIPTLLLEATNDGVLTAEMKADAKTRLPLDREEHMITGSHMSFSTFDDDGTLSFFKDGPATEGEKVAQRNKTIEYTLAFMRGVIATINQ